MAGRVFYQSGLNRPRLLPVVPDGVQIVGQLRQRAEMALLLPFRVESEPREARRPNSREIPREFDVLLRRVASGDDLDSFAAAVPELRKKRMQAGAWRTGSGPGAQRPAIPPLARYPLHGVTERGPLVLDERACLSPGSAETRSSRPLPGLSSPGAVQNGNGLIRSGSSA